MGSPPTGHKPSRPGADCQHAASPGKIQSETAPAVAAAPGAQHPPFPLGGNPSSSPLSPPPRPSSWDSREGEEEGGGSH